MHLLQQWLTFSPAWMLSGDEEVYLYYIGDVVVVLEQTVTISIPFLDQLVPGPKDRTLTVQTCKYCLTLLNS